MSVLRTATAVPDNHAGHDGEVASLRCIRTCGVLGHSWEDHRFFRPSCIPLKLRTPNARQVAYFSHLCHASRCSYVSLRGEQVGFSQHSPNGLWVSSVQWFTSSGVASCNKPWARLTENPITHMCGGYIDRVTLSVQPYVTQNGRKTSP